MRNVSVPVVLYAHQLRHIVLSRITELFCSRARRSLVCDHVCFFVGRIRMEVAHD